MRSAHPTCAALVLGAMLTLNATSRAQAPAASGGEGSEGGEGNGPSVTSIYDVGLKAAKKEKWEDARQAFLKAWQLKRHPQIAANLGRAELKVGAYREAAEHLAFFLREDKVASGEDRAKAQEMIAEARAKIGTITLRVEPAGTEVLVDGVPGERGGGGGRSGVGGDGGGPAERAERHRPSGSDKEGPGVPPGVPGA